MNERNWAETDFEISAAEDAFVEDEGLGDEMRLCEFHVCIPAAYRLAVPNFLPGSEKKGM